MKILIVSDTHRQNEILKKVIEKVAPIDLLIHLGDSEGAYTSLSETAGCPLKIVAGNNDFFSRLMKSDVFYLGKYKVAITHGHQHGVSSGLKGLKSAFHDADIIMFGHTHVPIILHQEGKVFLNPGSISYPRQEGRVPSYVIMEIDKNGDAHFTLNYYKK